MRFLKVIAVASFLASATAANAYCERYPTVAEEFAEADYVFIAEVTAGRLDRFDNDPDSFEGIEYSVRSLKTFKGEPPALMILFSENSTGRFPMMLGGWYLVFVGPPMSTGFDDPDRRELSVDNCGHSFALADVPMALQPAPTNLTFDEVMALAPTTE
jgi:hypothetical protein